MVTDEVYEHLVFDGEHVPIAQFPGMRERTVSVSSAGKTFSFTGWKIGWVKAAPELVTAVKTAKQFLTFVSGGPFQYAVAQALALPDEYYAGLRDDLRAQRDLLCAGLAEIGFEVFPPQGTYFVTADIKRLGYQDGVEFCRTLPDRVGVVAIPTAIFYDHPEAARSHVRFAFCKRPEVLTEALNRLSRLPDRGLRPTPVGVAAPWRRVPARPPGWDHGLREEPAAMDFAFVVTVLLLGCIAFALVREMQKASPRPAGLRGHIRARGWGLALLPAALLAAVMTGHVHALAVVEIAVAGALVTWAPRLAAKLVPYAVLALAIFGLILANAYHDGFSNQVLYGLVLAGAGSFRTRFVLLAGRGVLRPRHVAAPAGAGAGRRAGPGAGRPVAEQRPRRDLRRPGPAPYPGRGVDHAAARAG